MNANTSTRPSWSRTRPARVLTPVSVPVVKQLLGDHDYVARKAQKSRAMGGHTDRDRQFEGIARLKREYLASDDPIVSMDTKK